MFRISYLPVVCILLLLSSCNKNSPKPDKSGLFIKFFGGIYDNRGYSIAENGSGFIVVGSTQSIKDRKTNAYVVSVDENGNKKWAIEYGGDNNDEARFVRVDASGNIWVAGFSSNSKDSSDVLLLQLNQSGSILNEYTFGDPGANEIAYQFSFLSDGNWLLAGIRETGHDSLQNIYLVKANSDSMVWEREVGLSGKFDDLGKVLELSNGNIAFSGTTTFGNEKNMRLVMTNQDAALVGDYSYGEASNSDEYGKDLLEFSDGTLLISGYQGDHPFLVKTSENGNEMWNASPGESGQKIYSLIPANEGGYIAAGAGSGEGTDMLLMKLDAGFSEEWSEVFGGRGEDQGFAVLQTDNGDICLFGEVFSFHNYLFGFVKTASNGTFVREEK